MNVFVFFLVCIVYFLFALVIQSQDLFSPLVFTVGSFLIISFVCCIRNGFQGVDIRGGTLFLLCIWVLEYIIIYFLLELALGRRTRIANKTKIIDPKINELMLLATVSLLGVLYLWYSATRLAGYSMFSNPTDVISRKHNIITYTDYNRDYLSNILSYFIQAAGYYVIFFLLTKQEVNYQKKKHMISCFILSMFIISKIISGNRTWVIKTFVISTLYAFYINKKKIKDNFFKIAYRILLMLAVFVISFGLLGTLTGKTSVSRLNVDLIYGYSGSTLIGFDKLINNEVSLRSYEYIGARTFNGIYRFFVSLHIIPEYIHSREFVPINVGGTTTNIFTSYGTYYLDFGIVGIFFIVALISIFTFILYRRIRNKGYNCSPLFYYFYGVVMYGVVMQAIGAEITTKTIDFENVFTYFFLWIISSKNIFGVTLEYGRKK